MLRAGAKPPYSGGKQPPQSSEKSATERGPERPKTGVSRVKSILFTW